MLTTFGTYNVYRQDYHQIVAELKRHYEVNVARGRVKEVLIGY